MRRIVFACLAILVSAVTAAGARADTPAAILDQARIAFHLGVSLSCPQDRATNVSDRERVTRITSQQIGTSLSVAEEWGNTIMRGMRELSLPLSTCPVLQQAVRAAVAGYQGDGEGADGLPWIYQTLSLRDLGGTSADLAKCKVPAIDVENFRSLGVQEIMRVVAEPPLVTAIVDTFFAAGMKRPALDSSRCTKLQVDARDTFLSRIQVLRKANITPVLKPLP